MSDHSWRVIPGLDGYEVSSDGRVRSYWRPGGVNGRARVTEPRELSTHIGSEGYPRVKVANLTRHTAHLVALAFIGPRPAGADLRHLNGDRTDARVENLAYGSRSENQLDSVRHGTHNQGGKTHCIRGHAFTAENTYMRPTGGRRCRQCQTQATIEYQARRRLAS